MNAQSYNCFLFWHPTISFVLKKAFSIRVYFIVYGALYKICSRLSKHCKARGSSTGLAKVGLAKVQAHKYILFNEGIHEVEIKNTQFCWIGKDCDQNCDRMSGNNEKFSNLRQVTKSISSQLRKIWDSVYICHSIPT